MNSIQLAFINIYKFTEDPEGEYFVVYLLRFNCYSTLHLISLILGLTFVLNVCSSLMAGITGDFGVIVVFITNNFYSCTVTSWVNLSGMAYIESYIIYACVYLQLINVTTIQYDRLQSV